VALRIALYSQDGLGLGHLRRTSALAARLLASYPDASVLTLADSPRWDWFPLAPGNSVVRLPQVVRTGPDRWQPGEGGPLAAVLDARRAALVEAVAARPPDLLVVDHLPVGVAGELVPVLAAVRAAGGRTVLGLRDILDAPGVVRAQWAADGSWAAVEELYDAVLIYGEEAVFDAVRQYGFGAGAAAKARYCGYVAPPGYPGGGHPSRDHVVVVAGGGADAHAMLVAAVEAVALAARPLTVVTGPFLPERELDDVRRRAARLGGQVLRSVADVPSLLAGAGVVVSRAGYNATVEACRSGRPAVVVPRPGPSQEQRLRASAFSQRGWLEAVRPEAGPAELAAAIERAEPAADGVGPDLGGLDRVAGHLASLLSAGVPAG
jgi:predicted glycosyltransferase